MKITILFLALAIIASSTLVSCQSTGTGYYDDDPIPSGTRYAQERLRRR